MSETQLATRPDPASESIELVKLAMTDGGVDVDKLERVIAMRNADLERRAVAAFNEAFATFKAQCPKIVRRTEDEFITVTRNGQRCKRTYATLEDIAGVVDPVLSACGLTYDWEDAAVSAKGSLTRRCVVRHKDGHSRSTNSAPVPIEGSEDYKAMTARKETSASPQQRVGVADTYARRYSLVSALGLTTVDEDTDGRPDAPVDTITEDQATTIREWLRDTGADEARFLTWLGIAEVAEMPAAKYDVAMASLRRKAKQ